MRQLLETEQKALEINLDDSIYGTFAEIGAGQEVARHFFQVGAAAGTIAKTMSAYDKVYSDQIYGTEKSGRYVCETRVYKMLDHEYELMSDRLDEKRLNTNFFVFADTVAAINYQRTIKGDGWLGMRFQLSPDKEPNDLVLHVRLLDNDNQLQQQAIGILGVNLIYACFRYHNDPEVLLQSLMDSLKGRVIIDMVRLTGPDFEDLDNRLLSLWIVKHGLSQVSIFDEQGQSIHASEFLYRKNVLVVRGNYRPPTLLNQNMMQSSYHQFVNDPKVSADRVEMLTEVTLESMRAANVNIDEEDFIHRADILNALGQKVIVSNCAYHPRLVHYLADYKVEQLGLVFGVRPLQALLADTYHRNMDTRLLSAFGELFASHVRIYVYPSIQEDDDKEGLMTAQNVPIPDGLKLIYQHLLDHNQVVDIKDMDPSFLTIYSVDVLAQIKANKAGWEEKVPVEVAQIIKSKQLFGYIADEKLSTI